METATERTAEGPPAERDRTTVAVRCTGRVRSAVGRSRPEYAFEGTTLRAFLNAFFGTTT